MASVTSSQLPMVEFARTKPTEPLLASLLTSFYEKCSWYIWLAFFHLLLYLCLALKVQDAANVTFATAAVILLLAHANTRWILSALLGGCCRLLWYFLCASAKASYTNRSTMWEDIVEKEEIQEKEQEQDGGNDEEWMEEERKMKTETETEYVSSKDITASVQQPPKDSTTSFKPLHYYGYRIIRDGMPSWLDCDLDWTDAAIWKRVTRAFCHRCRRMLTYQVPGVRYSSAQRTFTCKECASPPKTICHKCGEQVLSWIPGVVTAYDTDYKRMWRCRDCVESSPAETAEPDIPAKPVTAAPVALARVTPVPATPVPVTAALASTTPLEAPRSQLRPSISDPVVTTSIPPAVSQQSARPAPVEQKKRSLRSSRATAQYQSFKKRGCSKETVTFSPPAGPTRARALRDQMSRAGSQSFTQPVTPMPPMHSQAPIVLAPAVPAPSKPLFAASRSRRLPLPANFVSRYSGSMNACPQKRREKSPLAPLRSLRPKRGTAEVISKVCPRKVALGNRILNMRIMRRDRLVRSRVNHFSRVMLATHLNPLSTKYVEQIKASNEEYYEEMRTSLATGSTSNCTPTQFQGKTSGMKYTALAPLHANSPLIQNFRSGAAAGVAAPAVATTSVLTQAKPIAKDSKPFADAAMPDAAMPTMSTPRPTPAPATAPIAAPVLVAKPVSVLPPATQLPKNLGFSGGAAMPTTSSSKPTFAPAPAPVAAPSLVAKPVSILPAATQLPIDFKFSGGAAIHPTSKFNGPINVNIVGRTAIPTTSKPKPTSVPATAASITAKPSSFDANDKPISVLFQPKQVTTNFNFLGAAVTTSTPTPAPVAAETVSVLPAAKQLPKNHNFFGGTVTPTTSTPKPTAAAAAASAEALATAAKEARKAARKAKAAANPVPSRIGGLLDEISSGKQIRSPQ